MKRLQGVAALLGLLAIVQPANSAELKIFGSRVTKVIVGELGPLFEKVTGTTPVVVADVAQVMKRRIEAGEPFDLAVLVDFQIDDLIKTGKLLADSRANIMSSGIGVAVKRGAPKPDIGTAEAFKQALLKAKSVGYIDPASGGSSGIYVAGLLDKLGIAEQIKPKAKLQKGGHVSDLVKTGEAEIGIHQNSEIVGQAGVTLVGPLPKDIQNYTTYAVGLGSGTKQAEAAKAFIKVLTGPSAAAVLKAAGMEGA
jgi:molybdate transport system substrate-binding protein